MSTENRSQAAVDLIAAYGAHLAKGDIASILNLYAADAEIVPDGLPSVRGASQIEDFYAATFAAIAIEGDLRVTSSRVADEMAVVRCEEPARVRSLADGVERTSYFREVFVLVWEASQWRILTYMFSENPAQAE